MSDTADSLRSEFEEKMSELRGWVTGFMGRSEEMGYDPQEVLETDTNLGRWWLVSASTMPSHEGATILGWQVYEIAKILRATGVAE